MVSLVDIQRFHRNKFQWASKVKVAEAGPSLDRLKLSLWLLGLAEAESWWLS
jgi:hypothetical protein